MQQGAIQNSQEVSHCYERHLLLTLRCLSSVSAQKSIQVSFSSGSETKDREAKFFPVFNNDRLHFMPAFVLEADKPKHHEYRTIYEDMHAQLRRDLSVQREELFVPKPSQSNSQCSICDMAYTDYLEHIDLEEHKIKRQQSPFNDDIARIAANFGFATSKAPAKHKPICKAQLACKELKKQAAPKTRTPRVPKCQHLQTVAELSLPKIPKRTPKMKAGAKPRLSKCTSKSSSSCETECGTPQFGSSTNLGTLPSLQSQGVAPIEVHAQ